MYHLRNLVSRFFLMLKYAWQFYKNGRNEILKQLNGFQVVKTDIRFPNQQVRLKLTIVTLESLGEIH